MKFTLALSLAALASAATRNEYRGYDALTPSIPNNSPSPVSPNPLGSIEYGRTFSVAELSSSYLSALNPASKPNVLLSTFGEVGKTTHSLRKPPFKASAEVKIKFFDPSKISLACVFGSVEEPEPIPCSILVEGWDADLGAVTANDVVKYDGGSEMTTYDFSGEFGNNRALDFTVTRAGDEVEVLDGVAVVLDSFSYVVTV